jgi:hypothetical protein
VYCGTGVTWAFVVEHLYLLFCEVVDIITRLTLIPISTNGFRADDGDNSKLFHPLLLVVEHALFLLILEKGHLMFVFEVVLTRLNGRPRD